MYNRILISVTGILVFITAGWFFIHTIKENSRLSTEIKTIEATNAVNNSIKRTKMETEHDLKTLSRNDILRGMCHYGWVLDSENCPN